MGPEPASRRIPVRLLLTAVALAPGLALALAGVIARQPEQAPRGGQVIGLYTSLPIVWRESADISGLLAADAGPHWARRAIERRGMLVPLDRLAGQGGALPLPGDALLILAQPWPLSPGENVALDRWVRSGGQVLLFADPMLTAQSAFALGDRRRPEDMAMLSPILTRWGLELRFDERRRPGAGTVQLLGSALPVNLPGYFALRPGSGCELLAGGLAARCRIGAGTVLAVADAALFEDGADGDGTDGDGKGRGAMLDTLIGDFSR